MKSVPLIFAWQFWRQHRLGLLGVASWLIGICGLYAVAGANLRPEVLGLLGVIPLFLVTVYVFAIFSHGLNIDLTAKESGFPRRLFTLPVPTFSLVVWPMLFAALVLGVVWLALGFFVFRVSRVEIALASLALLSFNFVAWGQALCWFPFGATFVRLGVGFLGMLFLMAGITFTTEYHVPDRVMVPVLGGLWLAAFLFAAWGVALARHGVMPEWSAVSALYHKLFVHPWVRDKPFSHPFDAQFWLENRRARWLQLFGVAAALLLFLPNSDHLEAVEEGATQAGIFFAVPDVSPQTGSVLKFLALLLLIPALGGLVTGLDLGWVGLINREHRPFLFGLTRPLTCGEMIRAKLQVAGWNALRSCLVVFAIVGCWLVLTERHHALGELRQAWFAGVPDWKIILLGLVAAAGLILLTWIHMTTCLWVGLTGRQWMLSVLVFAALSLLLVGVAVPEWPVWFYVNLNEIAWTWIAAKLVLGVVLGSCLLRQRLLETRALIRGVGAWVLVTGGGIALGLWLLPAERFAWHGIVLTGLALIPFNRLAVAPLALAWHRHR
jgi:hypothetical protein